MLQSTVDPLGSSLPPICSSQRFASYQRRATPWDQRREETSQALKARLIRFGYLIPHVSFIKVHPIFAQQFAVFFLERFGLMMQFLFIDITHQFVKLAISNGKTTVTCLPEE